MSVTIALPTPIEQRLRDDAANQGVSVEQYVSSLLIAGLSHFDIEDIEQLSDEELLQHAHMKLHPQELNEYYRLTALRQSGQITAPDYEKLLMLTNRVEMAHAERMQYIVILARKRNVPLEIVMQDLGLKNDNMQ